MEHREMTGELAGCRVVTRRFGEADLAALEDADRVWEAPQRTGSRWRMCARKDGHGERNARRIARSLNDRQVERVHAYPCPHCHRWHVGHADVALAEVLGEAA